MIEQSVSLASNGVVKVPGYEQLVRFGYTKNRGVYRLAVTASGEWEGLAIRCFWHVPNGKDPASSLVVDGYVDVPASVTAQPGSGCVTFEGSDGAKVMTSADLRYRVSANSGTEDGTEPEPGTPAWQQLVDAVHTDATAAEQAKTDAQTAAQQAVASASAASISAAAAGQSAQQAADNLQELKDGIANGVTGLEMGADDYIVKPFEMKELMARINAVLRRSEIPDDTKKKLVFDKLIINLDSYELIVDGKKVDTPPKELELLYHLASTPNRVYTRNQLLDEVWGFDYFGDSRTVDVHIKRLREKVENVSDQWALKTVWGVGYKFEVK